MRVDESIKCVKHLLAAERLLEGQEDGLLMANLSLTIERLREAYPAAKQVVDRDPRHLALLQQYYSDALENGRSPQ